MGGAHGVFFAAMEERIKAVAMLDGGFYNEKSLPGSDAVDFAARVKAPTLLVAGMYDWIFFGKTRWFGCLAPQRRIKKWSCSIPRMMFPSGGRNWFEKWSPGSTSTWIRSTDYFGPRVSAWNPQLFGPA
jgi:hypothetical protein